MSDETQPRILYVGNLDASVTEELLVTIFGRLGQCKGCKLIHESGNDLYAFVEYVQHSDAQMALMAMNKRIVLGKEMKVNWATSPGAQTKQDTSKHFHVFVGDLSPDIESHQLRDAFTPFGLISDCKVIRDSQTHQSKGFGFVCFVNKEEAEMAIASMNGQWLGGRTIRTNWANGKAHITSQREGASSQKSSRALLDYDEVFRQASSTNTTVYCGGIHNDLTEEMMRETFSQYGAVLDVRVFKDKGFAFVRLDTKETAAKAIVGVHGTEVAGFTVKCSWGKETTDTPSSGTTQNKGPQQTPQQQPGYGPPQGYYGGAMGYWGYPPQQQAYQQMPYMQQYAQQQPYAAAPYGNYGMSMQWPGQPYNGQ